MKVIMSIGNPIKSDDNIGNIVLEKIETDALKIRAETSPENFIDRMKGCDEIIILDALQFGGDVGEVKVFELYDVEDRLLSTHSIPIELLKKFFPNSKIKVIGIQPKNLDFGEEISKGLEVKMDEIVKKVTLFSK
ncbi:MAG: hydrogenase maturation protease [Candidatus Aenigmatarchaeota archaeon]